MALSPRAVDLLRRLPGTDYWTVDTVTEDGRWTLNWNDVVTDQECTHFCEIYRQVHTLLNEAGAEEGIDYIKSLASKFPEDSNVRMDIPYLTIISEPLNKVLDKVFDQQEKQQRR